MLPNNPDNCAIPHRPIKTYIVQFMKGQSYGELKAIAGNAYIAIEQFGLDTFVHIDKTTAEDIKRAEQGLAKAKTTMLSNNYDIIVLDEILVALHFNLIDIDQVIKFMQLKPPNIELILTGRKAPKQLIDLADLVSEIKEIKHYHQKGIPARNGIER